MKKTKTKSRRIVRIATPRTAKQFLRLLDEFFSGGGGKREAEKLWDVLTALRGPDDESYRLKDNHTIPIRRAALPRTASEGGGKVEDRATFGWTTSTWKEPELADHFASHAKKAATALKLR